MLNEWARAWGIHPAAIQDLQNRLTAVSTPEPGQISKSEALVQQNIRVNLQKHGTRLFRNNVGAAMDPRTNRPVRYGLCNESKAINEKFKSSDLIGVTPVTVTPYHVGNLMGVFTSIECKKSGWKYRGNKHEKAQLNWLQLITSLGGIARFSTGE